MSPADLPPFLLAVAFLIAVHEWGHFRMARACGVKVLRFSVGFGRVLWRRVGRDGTEFTLAMLPLGAMCGCWTSGMGRSAPLSVNMPSTNAHCGSVPPLLRPGLR